MRRPQPHRSSLLPTGCIRTILKKTELRICSDSFGQTRRHVSVIAVFLPVLVWQCWANTCFSTNLRTTRDDYNRVRAKWRQLGMYRARRQPLLAMLLRSAKPQRLNAARLNNRTTWQCLSSRARDRPRKCPIELRSSRRRRQRTHRPARTAAVSPGGRRGRAAALR
jgi:hypothetical protein